VAIGVEAKEMLLGATEFIRESIKSKYEPKLFDWLFVVLIMFRLVALAEFM
jgi:hypothetical protein